MRSLMPYRVAGLSTAVALLVAHVTSAAGWGDLSGRVVIRFRTPPAPPMALEVQGQTLVEESLLVTQDGGLINAVLFVRTRSIEVHPEVATKTSQRVTMTLRNHALHPRILPVWAGRQSVVFENQDAVGDNLSVQPVGDQAINQLLRPGDSATFQPGRQQATPLPVGCTIHPWLRGYVVPRDNPYVAVTDASGRFQLAKLPDQELEFQLWHERFGYLETPQQPQGRFTRRIEPGKNDLGTIVVER